MDPVEPRTKPGDIVRDELGREHVVIAVECADAFLRRKSSERIAEGGRGFSASAMETNALWSGQRRGPLPSQWR